MASTPASAEAGAPLRAGRRNAAITLASVILVDGAFFSTMPLLPSFLAEMSVAPASQIARWTGVLMGITPLLAAAAGPWWGKVGDRTGLCLMAMRGTGTLALVWLASAFATNPYQLLVLRILLGFLGGYQTLVMALATHGGAPASAGRTIARVQMTQIATAALAPVLGGYLSGIVGIRALFGAASASCFAATAMFWLTYRNVASGGAELPGIEPHARTSAIRFLAFLLFLQAMIDRSFQPASALWAAAHAGSAAESAQIAGIILSVGAFGDGLAAWWCGRSLRSQRRRLLVRSACGSAICFLLSYAVSVPAMVGLRLLLSIFAQGGLTMLYTMAAQLVPERTRSSDFGLLSSCVLFGQGAGSLAAGLLAARDIRHVFYLNAALFALLLALVRQSNVVQQAARRSSD